MKIELIKEARYALRSGRMMILLVSFLFFALLTPLMLKVVLPQVLGSQLERETTRGIESLMEMTQLGCIQSYMGDVFEIGTIIIAFTLCGLIASEIRDNTWVLPLCAGKRFGHMVGAKLLIFGVILILISIFALFTDYVYSGLLFGFEVGIFSILYGGVLQGVYMLFLLSCLMMWGAFTKRPIPAGVLTLATSYGIHFVSSLFGIERWTPSGLLKHAIDLSPTVGTSMYIPLSITILLVVSMTLITIALLRRMEWSTRNP